MTAFFQSLGMTYEWAWFVATVTGILLIALPLMLAIAMIIYADRKIWAAIALRRGPNVVGPWGLLQSFADGLKVFLQETIIPSSANRGLFLIAPIITFTVALVAWAVIPFSATAVLANINVGLLYILAASSLGVYGVVIAGWSSNSKYPFYSALRAAAQMVSYEVSIGFVLLAVVMYAGSFNMQTIVVAQQGHIFGLLNGFGFNPLIFPMAVVFLISAMAETARAPFDLTEAESELVAGYQTEYSSMSFALFWLGEYGNVILMCALNAVLFWGGWLPPIEWAPLYYVPGIIWLFLKIWCFFFIFSWVKATVPRYRYDQLMRLGWKIFLPLSLIFVFLISGWLMLTRYENRVQISGVPAQDILMEMQATGATDVCFPENANSSSDPVYLTRSPHWFRVGQTISIIEPVQYSGDVRIEASNNGGFGGSAYGQGPNGEVGFSFFDVVDADGRPAIVLWMADENGQPQEWGCMFEYEVEEVLS